ncbi:MAG: pyridoxamine 5'-phosphate oxidase family protein [Spirochaetia bacterium]|nr:pyridoxamine 5'-phosphate oxidase family protein [Spirochaetia bacterium]
MSSYEKELTEAWANRQGPAVFTTMNKSGLVNSVYVSSIDLDFDVDGSFVIADNYFTKTNENIDEGSKGSVLFITKDFISYQAKGEISCHTSGSAYEFMKEINPSRFPGHKAVVLHISSLYKGSTQLL